jgi:putative tryptophan/tyrosine transport system substrate-binding protein
MRRREFIALLGSGAAATWPLAARAQQPALPIVGFVSGRSTDTSVREVAAFQKGFNETGYVEGQNVAVEYRYADNQLDQLPTLVADLIRRPVAVLVCNNYAALAAKAATTMVPIVFASGTDPVKDGLVDSFNSPGGNVMGVSFLADLLGAKRLDLLRQLVPKAATIGMLVYLNDPDIEVERREMQAAAQAIGRQLIVLDVSSARDIETAFARFVERGADALQYGSGAFFNSHREQIVSLATRHRLPAIHNFREAVVAGGLMSYAPSITDAYRQAGIYVGRILKGEKPADLPVMQSTKFEFVLNLKTAKALSLDIPPTLLALTDAVIE